MEVKANFNKNIEAVRNASNPDISVNRLATELNKEIDKDYINKPTNDRFVVTQENKRGKVTFPMVLITDTLCSVEFKDTLKEMLQNVPKSGKQISVSYVQDKSVIYLCHTYANNKTIKTLNDFCIQYKYVISKGVIDENPQFEDDVDYSLFKPLIVPTEDNLVEFKEEVEEDNIVTQDILDLQNQINEMINSQNKYIDNNSHINNLINTPNVESTSIEKPIVKQTPDSSPSPIEQEDSVVKGW